MLERLQLSNASRIGLLTAILIVTSGYAQAQDFESIPFSDSRWEISGDDSGLESYRGQPSVRLDNGNGYAQLGQVDFSNGIIEFDFAISSAAGFPGIQFRMQDDLNFEDVYFRAHMNAKDDALAYAPTYDGNSTWQLFHGPGFWGNFTFEFGEWTHARMVISGNQGELYLRDMETPVMFFHDLKMDEQDGLVGMRGGSDVHFANFKIAHVDNYPLKGQAPEWEADPEGVLNLTSWQISDPFNENLVADLTSLDEMTEEVTGWAALEADDSKIANVMRLHGITEQENTVFARVNLSSDSEVAKILELGYSDRVRVFLNGKKLYEGNNGFRSRDYRYLGSIGLFEKVVLPLNEGNNELWLALSESFGGWGVLARLENAGSVSLGGSTR